MRLGLKNRVWIEVNGVGPLFCLCTGGANNDLEGVNSTSMEIKPNLIYHESKGCKK